MNPFTQHTQQQGVTYIAHFFFAAGIARRLANSVFAFTTHAIFPFIHIDKTLDLEAMIDYLDERNKWIESAKSNKDNNSSMPIKLNNQRVGALESQG